MAGRGGNPCSKAARIRATRSVASPANLRPIKRIGTTKVAVSSNVMKVAASVFLPLKSFTHHWYTGHVENVRITAHRKSGYERAQDKEAAHNEDEENNRAYEVLNVFIFLIVHEFLFP